MYNPELLQDGGSVIDPETGATFTAAQLLQARRQYAGAIAQIEAIESKAVILTLKEFLNLPNVFVQAQNIWRQVINEMREANRKK